MKDLKLIMLLVLFPVFSAIAQDDDNKNVMRDGTIDEQFEYVMKKSYKYSEGGKSYRVVRTNMLTQLGSNVDKAIDKLETDLGTSNTTIEEQKTEISTLQKELQTTNNDLSQVNKDKNNMSFLGTIPMKKGAYRTIMWAIIASLIIFLLIFISSFLRSNAVTKQTKKTLDKTREEFDEYRKKSMEEELVLRRKLQTEVNKNL